MSTSSNVALLLDGPVRRLSERTSIVTGDRPDHTWATLGEQVARRAGWLRHHHGVLPGERVAIVSANRPVYLEALFAIWHAGAVAVPISDRLHPREIAELLHVSDAKVCWLGPEIAEPLVESVPEGCRAIVFGEQDRIVPTVDPIQLERRAASEDAWIFFTSGTTGRAKGARLSHGNLLAMNAAYHADVAQVEARDSLLHLAALSHASGLFALPFLARGAMQVLPHSRSFDASETLALIEANERSTFFVPPTLLRRLNAAAIDRPVAENRFGRILVGAAPVLADDLRAGVSLFGPCLWNGYGQGESPCTITAMDPAALAASLDVPSRLTSVGTARLATRVRVVDTEDRPLPPGEVGEVVVDGPTVMSGYLDLPEESASALAGGWLHTGDLGRFDDDGYLMLIDRAKDLVISGGSNVYPREVEEVLAADPSVSEVAVLGLPDPDWGEQVVAVVIPTSGSTIDFAALDARCLATIARHKRPRRYIVVDDLPRNPGGKVLKRVLRERMTAAEGGT